MKKIGLLGGTFDPVHNGHLIIAEYLRDELSLDQIWFIPARIHPLKNNHEISPPRIRLKMLQLAIQENENFRCSEIELKRNDVSFTIDTLQELLDQYRHEKPRFFYFIGMDNVNELVKWKEPMKILEKCQVVAFGRPGFKPSREVRHFIPAIQFVHPPLLEISSTAIRDRVASGLSIRYLVPDAVRDFIVRKGLYRSGGK